ncbi:MAG: BamA/TamA family outer membrane protein [Ignavibacteria bacterium]|nr:BamA/TamA family outer membrane protein [Ignavibacteria bacterium]
MLVFLFVLANTPTLAQQREEERRYEVNSIEFEGNDVLGISELLAQLATKETPGFLNKFLYDIWDRLGRKDEYFDGAAFDEDVERLHRHYIDKGFSDVQIDTVLRFSEEDKCVNITFLIQEGYRAIIDSVIYKGFLHIAGTVWAGIKDDPKIEKGDPFDRVLVEEEATRVREILRNEGYPKAEFVRDSSFAKRVLSTGNYSIVLAFDSSKRYWFGRIEIAQEPDSLRREEITDGIVINQLDYEPGQIYSESSRKESERNLNRVGIFDQARILVTVPASEDTSRFVTTHVFVRPRDKHEFAPEILVSDENGTFNLGTGIGYANRNFFGGARTFSTRLRFRTQTIGEFPDYFETNSDAVSNVDLTFELLQPYIFTNTIKGSWSFSVILDKQKLYRQEIIRNKFGFTSRFTDHTTGFLDWTLQSVRLRRNASFREEQATQEQISELRAQENEVQFNSIISFTIQRDRSNDIFSPSAGFVHSATFEESGLLPLLLKKAQPDLPFTQFYRVSLLGRWYFDLTGDRFSVFAFKLKGGLEEKYGESRSDTTRAIPQTHRFYAGGGGSVRGWGSRDLSATGVPEFGGDLAFEGSVELRTNVLKSLQDDLLDKIWIVTFLDFGNVWGKAKAFQVQDIAVAAGIGLRYDTFFGPFRIDFGFRVYDPGERDPGKRWITQRKFFGETIKGGSVHVGIGHAF